MEGSTDPDLGRTIRGYHLQKMLRHGKLTTLFHAHTEELWTQPELAVTLFHLPPTLPVHIQAQFEQRFVREAKRLIKLRHPSLFPLFGYGKEEGTLYLLHPLDSAGLTLTQRLKKQKYWSPSEAFTILAPLSSAFDYIHSQGLMYQFFTPSNILFQDNTAPQITGLRLPHILLMGQLDEGIITTEANRHLKNIANDYISAPEYLAPEVIRGEQPDKRSDIYSLGIILFELLSGKLPFSGGTYMEIAHKHIREPLPPLHEIAPDIPIALELIINRALHRHAANRFATAGEFITAFSHVLDERLRTPSATPTSQTLEQMRSASRSPFGKTPQRAIAATSEQKQAESTTPPVHQTNAQTQIDMEKMAQHIQQLRQQLQSPIKIQGPTHKTR